MILGEFPFASFAAIVAAMILSGLNFKPLGMG
jgi:hypothetical protein